MNERLCPFCDEPLDHVQTDRKLGIEGSWYCVPCGHIEGQDIEPPDPPGFEGGFAKNH